MVNRIRSGSVIGTFFLTWIAGTAAGQPVSYRIHRAGLYGPDYTSSAGYSSVGNEKLSRSGLLTGQSLRYLGTASGHGNAVWVYDRGVTTRIGYFDAVHTSPTGDQDSSFVGINAPGTIAGSSVRYVGSSTGRTAWIFQQGAPSRLGYTDGLFTGPGGLQSSSVVVINDAGQVAGTSVEYRDLGIVARSWVWDHGMYTDLGLTNVEHTRSDGARSGRPVAMNSAGDIAGISTRFAGSGSLGESAWLMHGGVTSRIGLRDAINTSSAGVQLNEPYSLSENGTAVGTAQMFLPGGVQGTETWIGDGQGTARIGLFDSEHTALNGQQLCDPVAMSGTGNVIGSATRFLSNTLNGESAWLYSNGASVRIGLVGAGYTGTSGYQVSRAVYVNNQGEVLGNSISFTPQGIVGRAAWIYQDGETRRVGLFDAQHTDPTTGVQSTFELQLNSRGDAMGRSSRYVGATVYDDAWFYDRASDSVVPLVFSTSPDGVSAAYPNLLTDDGFVYGIYFKWDGADPLGYIAFRWSMQTGMEELPPMIEGGLENAGWSNFQGVTTGPCPGTWDHTELVALGRFGGESSYTWAYLNATGICGSADFNCDGSTGTDQDISSFFACLAGDCPRWPCRSTADFDDDGDVGTDADIEAFFRVLGGGSC